MPAGTVISGGFPGRVAQEVQPNQKCEGCLHYDGQAGRTGACTIGLRPWLCGEGDSQDIGYAPLTRGAGSYLPDMSNHGAHATETTPQQTSDLHGVGSTRPVQVHQVSLGEEHVHLVKSLVARHTTLQKALCRSCSMRGTYGIAPPNVGVQVCSCAPLEAVVVAKAIISRMSNAQRSVLSNESADPVADVAQWVRDVAKAGFRLPVPKKAHSLGDRVGERGHRDDEHRGPKRSISDQVCIDDSGGHLRPTSKVLKSDNPVEKGTLYHPQGKYDISPAGGGEQHVDFSPRAGGASVRVGTFGSHKMARRAAIAHGERLASGSGKVSPSTSAPTRKMRVGSNASSDAESVSKSLEFKPHPESPNNIVARAPHGEYEISPTSSKHHRIDYYVGSGDTPAHTERLPSRAAAIRYANEHHEKISRARAR